MEAAYFADAPFWIALSSRRDQFHPHAIAWRQHLVRSRVSLVTTEAVLWEWMNELADPAMRGTAAEGYPNFRAFGSELLKKKDLEIFSSLCRVFFYTPPSLAGTDDF